MTNRFVVASVLVVSALASACAGGHSGKQASRPEAVRARVGVARRIEAPVAVELSGTVSADRVAALSSRVMATVTAVHVHAGDAVVAGQVLVEIDPQTARGQEAQARGALAQAQAALSLAERNYGRFKALASTQAAAELEVDMARMQYEQARGAVEQAQGAVEAASSVARESRVVAPFAGRVAATLAEVGDLAAPGRPLVMLESSRGRRLVASVPESSGVVPMLRPGTSVPVSIDSLPALGELRGTVVEVTSGADPATHAFTVKIELPDRDIATGLAGRAMVPGSVRRSLIVPAAAVLVQGGLSFVVVRDGGGAARSRIVTTGVSREGGTEVLSGLRGDEELLLDLQMVPADGAPVEEIRR